MPNSPLTQLVYVSDATQEMPADELDRLEERSKQRNAEDRITGLLLYGGGHFLQVLEGPTNLVNATYARIQIDPRHTHLRQIVYQPVEKRKFGEWSMKLISADHGTSVDRCELQRVLKRYAVVTLDHGFDPHRIVDDLVEAFAKQLSSSDGQKPAAA
ncbi:MAG: BLUF domain-containing protein [Planctomycetota bacterium]